MLKFENYSYTRPDIKKVSLEFNSLIIKFEESDSFEKQNLIISKLNNVRNNIESMFQLVLIRHSIDTRDSFYEKENEFVDETMPLLQGLVTNYYEVLIKSKFRNELEEKWGKQIFTIAELSLKVFKPEILELLQKENKLVSEYSKLMASAKIMFDGEERNLSQMTPYAQSKERKIRLDAQKSVTEFFKKNESQLDKIYDNLVSTRHEIAIKLGFNNFVELGYARLLRSDYDATMTANYRKQVLENIVPLSNKLKERQAKRLDVKTLKYYDEPLQFLTGNARPKGDSDWIINKGKIMYKELSKETDEFFNYMLDRNLLDVVAKTGKQGGGYCTFISDFKSPFIFSNFNGTSGDVDVLTHEAGHAFQVYTSRDLKLPEYNWATYEASEIHSMSMEFFAWPWMESFFEEEVEKYKFSHLSGALLFIPYGVTVDEFQHWVYENPTATPDERKKIWREIEKKYLPKKDYEGNDFLEKGGYWFRQGHIFADPFYYIDYTLAQVCAFEFWSKSRDNQKNAWNDYLTLCKVGGSLSFLQLVELANLSNPFKDGTIKKIVEPISKWLDTIDDLNL